MIRGLVEGFEAACGAVGFAAGDFAAGDCAAGDFAAGDFAAGDFAAGVLRADTVVTTAVTAPLPDGFLAGFRTADFLVVPAFSVVLRAPACFAASFLAADALAPLECFGLVSVAADLRAGKRGAVAFGAATFAALRFVPDPAACTVLGFAPRSCAAFGRETFTSPCMARPEDRPLAAAFAVARRVDLLCEVEAIGTTLVTVVTW